MSGNGQEHIGIESDLVVAAERSRRGDIYGAPIYQSGFDESNPYRVKREDGSLVV